MRQRNGSVFRCQQRGPSELQRGCKVIVCTRSWRHVKLLKCLFTIDGDARVLVGLDRAYRIRTLTGEPIL
jgi:hypothetical protein